MCPKKRWKISISIVNRRWDVQPLQKKWALVGQLFVLFEVVDQTHFLFWAIFDNFKATSDTLGIFSFKVILGQQIIQGKKLVLTQVHFFVSKKRQFLPRWLWAKLLADSSIFIFHRWFSHLEVLQKSVPSFFNWIYFRFWLFKLSIEIYVIYHLGTKSNVMGTILEFFDLHIWDKNYLKIQCEIRFSYLGSQKKPQNSVSVLFSI